jgi:succinyl-CoA:(S)-malate CoA-transferase subunit A/succinyl-CoA:(S)-malate CoA-transferase subunit B
MGQVVDCALYESVFRALDEIAPRYAKDGFVREPEGTGTLNACPHGHFPSGDGKFLAIACTTDKMFERLSVAMKRPDLLQKYRNQKDRLKDRELVLIEVESWTRSMSRDDVINICTANGVPAGAVNSIADIFADPHFSARKTMTNVNVEKVGDVTVPNVFPTLSVSPGEVKTLGPSLGQNTFQFYEDEIGLSKQEINELREDGVI